MSRHLGNLIGNVHAFHHFTKYRVTEITLTMVKEGVIGNVDKELAGGAVFVGGDGCCFRSFCSFSRSNGSERGPARIVDNLSW